MKKHILTASARNITGCKVKKLRLEGLIPATVYGKNVKSSSLSVKLDEFKKIYHEAGESGLVELTVDGQIRPILIHGVQKDPIRGELLHVEFFQVDLKEKVHAKVPLIIEGVPPAVENKLGVLLTILDEVEVEALPTDLPENIVVDVFKLAEVNDEVKVSGLIVASGVTILTDGELTVAKIGSLITKEAEAEAAAEEAAAAEAKAETAAEAPTEAGAPEAATPEAPKEDLPAGRQENN